MLRVNALGGPIFAPKLLVLRIPCPCCPISPPTGHTAVFVGNGHDWQHLILGWFRGREVLRVRLIWGGGLLSGWDFLRAG